MLLCHASALRMRPERGYSFVELLVVSALLAILASAGVRYEEWMKFTVPLYVALVGLGTVSIAIGIAVDLA